MVTAVKNGIAISDICRHIVKVGQRMEALTMSMEQIEQGNHDSLLALYEEQRLGELENVQNLVMKLTELIIEEEAATADGMSRSDGSVFSAGELDAAKGDAVDGNPVEEAH